MTALEECQSERAHNDGDYYLDGYVDRDVADAALAAETARADLEAENGARLSVSAANEGDRADRAEAALATACRLLSKLDTTLKWSPEQWREDIDKHLARHDPEAAGYTYTDGSCDTCGCAIEGQHHSAQCVDAHARHDAEVQPFNWQCPRCGAWHNQSEPHFPRELEES